MANDFRSALARTQGDYDFYVMCHTDPGAALSGYSLTAEEQATLTDPARLAEALKPGGMMRLPTITITISGSHDWVNVSSPKRKPTQRAAQAAEAVLRAEGTKAREESALQLMQAIG